LQVYTDIKNGYLLFMDTDILYTRMLIGRIQVS